jgi:hypothetical protein
LHFRKWPDLPAINGDGAKQDIVFVQSDGDAAANVTRVDQPPVAPGLTIRLGVGRIINRNDSIALCDPVERGVGAAGLD